MENLAHGLVTTNAAAMVSKVYDEYLDIIALEPNLYTLNIPDSFLAYNDPGMTEADIRAYISRLCNGLMSLVRVMGVLPIIRAPGGGPAEMLGQELCSCLRENLSPRGQAHSIFGDFLVSDRPRPLLLILDRGSDLASPLMHASTYQALVDDLLDYKLNKVSVSVSSKDQSAAPKKKTYDLNSQVDTFFRSYAGAQFPEAVDANEVELAAVAKREAEIRSRPGAAAALAEGFSGSDSLSEAITSLPEILNKKANLEAHTNILQAVMKEVAAREVPTFFELEQTMLQSGGGVDKAAVLELLEDAAKGTLEDKARLFAIVTLLSSQDKTSSAEEYAAAFSTGCRAAAARLSASAAALPEAGREAEVDAAIAKMTAAVNFLRRLKKLQSPMGGYGAAGGMRGESKSAMISTLLSSATSGATSLMARATALFAKFSPLPVSTVVENLAEGRTCAEDESYCFLDPRQQAGSQRTPGQKYAEVVVFVVGGGCLTEYFNLQEMVQQKRGTGGGAQASASSTLRNVVYGGSEMYCSAVFLEQLQKLGAKGGA
jgi:sec1 family domain-containing protein 1